MMKNTNKTLLFPFQMRNLRNIFVLLLILSLCIPCSVCGAAQGTKRYLVLGDSIAAHDGVEEKDSYGYLLAKGLEDLTGDTWTGENLGHNGDESSDLLSLLQSLSESEEGRGKLANTDLFVISIGGNTLLHYLAELASTILITPPSAIPSLLASLRERSEKVREELYRDMTAILTLIRKNNEQAPVLLLNAYNNTRELPFDLSFLTGNIGLHELTNTIFSPYLYVLSKAAESVPNVYIADTYSAFHESDEPDLILPDQVHPTPAGHRLILSALLDTYRATQMANVR